MIPDQSEPDRDSPARRTLRSAGELYPQVTPLRRQDVCSRLLVVHVVGMTAIGFAPIFSPSAVAAALLPVGLVTGAGVVLVCVMAITGPIDIPQLDYGRGELEQWGIANKIAAVIMLLLSIAGGGFSSYWIFWRK